MSLNVCIFGVSGYTGSKLLEYLCKHKNVKILGVFGKKSKGIGLEKLFPNIDNLPKIKISDYREFKFDNVDLIFSCLPHGEFQNSVINNLDPKIAIIDLSGDFRLKSAKDYEKFYKIKHKSPNFLKKFTYGLSEINKKEIVNSKFISNPGCYPTSILLPLIPLLKNNMIDKSHIVIDSKSGISGAGKKPKNKELLSEIKENFFSYNIFSHRHFPEILQEIKVFSTSVSFSFIPHLLPIFSGIHSTLYIEKKKYSSNDISKVLKDYYKDSYFISLYDNEKIPKVNDVKNTNKIALKVFEDYSGKRIIILSCIDNLVKGAAGQAIQNMNLMNGFDERESLI